MAAEIQFDPETFQSFRAIVKVHLGKLAMDVREGDIVQFNGQTIKIAGVDYPYTELRAAIKVGWFVPEADNISNYKPKSADVKVRSALDSKKEKQAPTTVSDDERDVGPARRRVIKADDSDEAKEVKSFSRAVKNQDDVERPVGPSTRKASEMQTDSVGNEDAKTIGRVRTPAVQKTVISDGAQAAREAARLDNAPPPRAVLASPKGKDIYAAEAEKVESIIDTLNPEDRARIIAEQRKAQAKVPAKVSPEPAPEKAAPKTRPSAKAQPKAATPAPEPTPEPAKKAAKTPIPKSRPTTVEEVILQGDEIPLGDGLVWDKNLHWRTRAKIAAEQYGDKPEALKAIMAIETPAVVVLINERLKALGKKAS